MSKNNTTRFIVSFIASLLLFFSALSASQASPSSSQKIDVKVTVLASDSVKQISRNIHKELTEQGYRAKGREKAKDNKHINNTSQKAKKKAKKKVKITISCTGKPLECTITISLGKITTPSSEAITR